MIRQRNTQIGSPLRVGTFGDNHTPFLIPSWPHATTGISTQVVNAAAGTGAMNIAGALGTLLINESSVFYPPYPVAVGTSFSGAGEAATIVVVGLDSTGQSVTETIAKGTAGTAANGKVLWSRIDSVTITVNGLTAQTFTVGCIYRTATSITGVVFLPLPFQPLMYTDVNGLRATLSLKRIFPMLAGGGAWTACSYETAATIGSGAGKMWIPTAATYSSTSGSSGVPVFTSNSAGYNGGQALAMLPNVTTPANVTTAPIWALTPNASSLLEEL